ncbi:MAG TPA: hypothetical protein VKC56_03785 [Gallionellaceae bacterium]|nr:hypothetical protein [Gallionellaceae bacterium]
MANGNEIANATPDDRFTFEAHPRIIRGGDDGEPEFDEGCARLEDGSALGDREGTAEQS